MPKLIYRFLFIVCIATILFACKNSNKPPEKDVVKAPEQLEVRTTENLRKILSYATDKKGTLNDSVNLSSLKLIKAIYEHNNYKVIWSKEDQLMPIADSLLQIVQDAKEYGLFPADYNYSSLYSIRNTLQHDSVSRRDAALLSRADILWTAAYLDIARHLKLGRLQRDSITMRKDSIYNDDYFIRNFNKATANNNIILSLHELEPSFVGYKLIRENIKSFLDSADLNNYTYIYFPYKDSLLFIKSLQKRLG